MGPTLKASITFPIDWINDLKKREYLSENLARLLKKGDLRTVYQTSSTDKYFASVGQPFIMAYLVRFKYHAYQPLKIKMTQTEMEEVLKPVFPSARCVGFDTFFIQGKSPSANPFIECEIYY